MRTTAIELRRDHTGSFCPDCGQEFAPEVFATSGRQIKAGLRFTDGRTWHLCNYDKLLLNRVRQLAKLVEPIHEGDVVTTDLIAAIENVILAGSGAS